MVATIDQDLLWEWCRDAYLRRNVRLAFPAHTDRTRTYQWRFLTSLLRKIQQWNFSAELARQFIEVVTDYAVDKRLLTKGLAIFHQQNLMDHCYQQLQRRRDNRQGLLAELAASANWFREHVLTSADPVAELLRRPRIGGYPNLVLWYQAGHLSQLFLASSRLCGRALGTLTRTDTSARRQLPADVDLVTLRLRFFKNAQDKFKARVLLGDDWRN